MGSVSFKDFVSKNPDWQTKCDVCQLDSPIFKRIICYWERKSLLMTAPSLHHWYYACINVNTGDIYIDDPKKIIFLKHLGLMFLRPIQTIIKTLWHLSIIGPLATQLFRRELKKDFLRISGIPEGLDDKQLLDSVKNNRTALIELGFDPKDNNGDKSILKKAKNRLNVKPILTSTLDSLTDIVRTPIYGIAMTIVHIAGAILGCISPNTLYKTRELVGKLDRRLLRVQSIREVPAGFFFTVSRCFSPWWNILYDGVKEASDGAYNLREQIAKAGMTPYHKQIIRLKTKGLLTNNTFISPFGRKHHISLPQSSL